MLAGLAAVAAAGDCPSHSVAAPADAPFDTRCAWTTDGASSLFACVEKCAADGGVPACPNSTAEYAWLAETAAELRLASSLDAASFGDFHEFDHLVRNVFEMRRSRTERFSVDLTSV